MRNFQNLIQCSWRDLNPGPLALESTALPTELSRLDGSLVEIRGTLRILGFGREMDPERSSALSQAYPAGIFNFMLDLVSDNEIDGLADLIPKLSSTCL